MIVDNWNDDLNNSKWYYFTSQGESETKTGDWWYRDTDGKIIELVI